MGAEAPIAPILMRTLKNALKNLTNQENSTYLMLSLSIFVALILIDVCAALQQKQSLEEEDPLLLA